MPKRLLAIGLLFCLGGVLAIGEVVTGLLNNHLNINFAVCLLPVGIGLLKGKSSSHGWARFWIICGYVLCAVMAIVAIVNPGTAHATWLNRVIRGSAAVPYVLIVAGIFASLLYLMHRALCSEVVTAYISAKPGGHPSEVTEDDMSTDTTCLQCGKTIAAGTASCMSCGWSYRSTEHRE